MVYQWKAKSFLKADAQAAGEQMASLEKQGKLSPQSLVDANREEGAPLHDEFEWDNQTAADEYRKTQAQYFIRQIIVTDIASSAEPVKVRAFVSTIQDDQRTYLNISRVLSEKDLRDQMLATAKAEALSFKAKYECLEELSAVFEAIDEVTA